MIQINFRLNSSKEVLILKRKTFVAAFNSIIIIFALFVIAFIVFGFKFEKTNNEKLKYEIENIKTNEKMIRLRVFLMHCQIINQFF